MLKVVKFKVVKPDILFEFLTINFETLLIVILLFYKWLFSTGYLLVADLSFPLFSTQFSAYYWPTWNQYQNADTTYSLLYLSYPSTLFTYILVSFGLINVPTAIKLIIVIPFFIGSNAFYYFIRETLVEYKIKRNVILLSAIISNIVFLTSPASLNLLVQEVTTFQTMTLFPLLLLFLKKTYRNGSFLSIVGVSLVSAMCFTGPHSILLWIIMVAIFSIFYISKRNMKRLIYILLLTTLYSTFWILPIFLGSVSSPSSTGFITSRLYIQGKDIMDVLTGLAWYSVPFLNYPNPFNILWLFPLLLGSIPVFYTIRIHPDFKLVLAMIILAILSIAFIQGSKGILGSLYGYLFQVSGFYSALFRVNYYFYGLFVFVWTVLASLGLAILISKAFSKNENKITISLISAQSNFGQNALWAKITKPLISILIIIIILISFLAQTPAFTGDLGGNYIPSYPPTAYQSVNHWLKSQGKGFNVLWLPPNTYTVTWNYPRITNLYFVAASSSVPSFQWFSRNILYYIYYRIYLNDTLGLGKLLSILNIKYVIYHDDVDQILGDPSAPQKILNNLQRANSLKLVLNDPPIYVYENLEHNSSIISTTRNVMYVSGGPDAIAYLNSFSWFRPEHYAIYDLETSYYSSIPFAPLFSSSFNSSIIFLNDFELYNVILPMLERYYIDPSIYTNFLNNWKYWIPQDSFSFYYNYIISYNPTANNENLFNTPVWVVDGPNGANTQPILVNYYEPETTFELPIHVNESGNYLLFIRVFSGIRAGYLTIQLSNLTNSLSLYAPFNKGFSWVKIGKVYLDKDRMYTLTIKSIKGVNAFSLVALVPERVYMELSYLVLTKIENRLSNLIYVIDYRGFNYSLSPLGFIPMDDSSSGSGWVLAHGSSKAVMALVDARFTKSYIQIPYFNALNQTKYTVSFWLKLLLNKSYNYENIITLPGMFSAYLDSNNNLWVYVPGRAAGFPLLQMKLYHIVIINNGTSLTYYINGKPLVGTWSSLPGNATGSPLVIGLNGTYEKFSPFLITNLQFYSDVLTPNDVQQLYISGPSSMPLQSNLPLWAPLNGSNIYYTNGKAEYIMLQYNVQKIFLKGENLLNITLPVFQNQNISFYVIARQYASEHGIPGTISLLVDGENISQSLISSNNYRAYYLGSVNLGAGMHKISLEVDGNVAVKALFAFILNKKVSNFTSASKTIELYVAPDGQKFILHVNLPTIIIYNSWYSSGMLLKVNDITLPSYASFIAMNTFVIGNVTRSPLTAQIVYYPQIMANYGIIISIVSLAVSAFILVYLRLKRRIVRITSVTTHTISDN